MLSMSMPFSAGGAAGCHRTTSGKVVRRRFWAVMNSYANQVGQLAVDVRLLECQLRAGGCGRMAAVCQSLAALFRRFRLGFLCGSRAAVP